ncbi:MAG TPA: methionine--tRNA ligase [Polyangiaceae bacterium]|mgnify:CR=1 FL=1|nr:methionine--tRNA ligase [Polyangiaceae bacterium]
MARRILVTSALPYANGHIHLGHLVEYLQTDIWARFQRLAGHRAVYVCADDTHGTAIMIRAAEEGRPEEALISEMSAAHQRDFADFQIAFDHYGSTHSASNRQIVHEVWAAHRRAGHVFEQSVAQLFDPVRGVFLADRFVRGSCPHCHAPDQAGDNCSSCGRTYAPTELEGPVSTLSGATPEIRSAQHLFVDLERMRPFLVDWVGGGERLQPEIKNYLRGHFLEKPAREGAGFEPLRPWDVSRPAPYFGFEIPDSPGNYFYVWFDAPLGYVAATADWCEKTGERFDDWWRSDEVEIHHFIGKDITYFHTLFWPAMLKTAGLSLPRRVQIHGFLTVNGEKMSKRTGTFVLARTYLEHLDPAFLRYYYASKLGPRVEDLDLNLEELVDRVNSHLVGKVVNLASRSARFVEGRALAATYPDDEGLFAAAAARGAEIARAYDECDFARAMREVMALADRANEYVDRKQPWQLKKQPERAAELVDVCTVALNLFRQLAIYLAPVLPKLAADAGALLGEPITAFSQAGAPLVGATVGRFRHLLGRVDPKAVAAMIAESTVAAEPTGAGRAEPEAVEDDGAPLAAEPLAPECTIEDFTRVDLRVARVVAAEDVKEAQKLLKLTVSLGGGERRTLFAGIKAAYRPEALVGRLVVIAANLAPRKMKFGTSEGMICAAGPGGAEVFVLAPDAGARPGQRIH